MHPAEPWDLWRDIVGPVTAATSSAAAPCQRVRRQSSLAGGRGVAVAKTTPIAIPDLDEAVVVRSEPEPVVDRNPCAYVGRAPRGTSLAPLS